MPASPGSAEATALLRIATRIHYALIRYLDGGIDVGTMLASDDYAREVLFVCAGSGDDELQALGRQFEQARAAAPRAAVDTTPFDPDDGREPVGSAPIGLDMLRFHDDDDDADGEARADAGTANGWLRRARRWLDRRR